MKNQIFLLIFAFLLSLTINASGALNPSIVTESYFQYFPEQKESALYIESNFGCINYTKYNQFDDLLKSEIMLNSKGFIFGAKIRNFSEPSIQFKWSLGECDFFSKACSYDLPFYRNIKICNLNYDQTGYYNYKMEWIKFGYGYAYGKNYESLNNSKIRVLLQPILGWTSLNSSRLTKDDTLNRYSTKIYGCDLGGRLLVVAAIDNCFLLQLQSTYSTILPSPDFHEIEYSGEVCFIFDKKKAYYTKQHSPLSIVDYIGFGPEAKIFLKISYLDCFINLKNYHSLNIQLGCSYRLFDFIPSSDGKYKVEKHEME